MGASTDLGKPFGAHRPDNLVCLYPFVMEHDQNALGQPLGPEVLNWHGAEESQPPNRYLVVTVESKDSTPSGTRPNCSTATSWTPNIEIGRTSPTVHSSIFRRIARWVTEMAGFADPLFFAVIDLASEQAVGVASLMRIAPEAGAIEIGHINYSPLLQRQRAGTEAMYLLMKRVFEDWGYRRYEWKCNALNAPSMAAAERLGFTFEGIFRQADVVKGRNRDTAWYSVVDSEWPTIKAGAAGLAQAGQLRRIRRQRQPLATQGSRR